MKQSIMKFWFIKPNNLSLTSVEFAFDQLKRNAKNQNSVERFIMNSE